MRQAEASEVDDLINRLAIWLDVPRQRVATAVHQVLDGHELEAARHHGVAVRGDTRQQRLAGLRAILEVEAGP